MTAPNTAPTPTPTPTPTAIDPGTMVGLPALTVSDLERSLAYYTEAIGFELLRRGEGEAVLGAAGQPLLELVEQPGAQPWPRGGRSYTGLYHFAILLPTRADLGRWLRHWLELGLPFGQGDHLVSEALYLEDPDMHGIEVYRDRPREEWTWEDGQVRMAVDPVDLRGLLAEAERAGEPWRGLPPGTRVGHIHLQVGDIRQAADFYHGILGFDIVAHMPSALFVSAGGYHHHLGLNTWHSLHAGPAPADSVRLRSFTVELPSEEARQAVVRRLDSAGIPHQRLGTAVAVEDPWQNTILLRVGPTPLAEA
ncbi:MAG TPA: VOC family protein [Nitrolancea sp.]|nr:VOC family protein [Nitrolancea sp.]